MADCASDFVFDRYLAGEFSGEELGQLERHIEACARCNERLHTLRVEREAALEFLPNFAAIAAPQEPTKQASLQPAPAPGVSSRHAPRSFLWAGSGALAAAAAAFLLFPSAPTKGPIELAERAKGTGGFELFVRHDGVVRSGGPGEVLAPGDSIQFAVTTPEPAYAAIVSVDGANHASAYFPRGELAEQLPAGRTELPLSTVLDDTLGPERLWLLLCADAVEIAPVLAELTTHPRATPNVPDCMAKLLEVEKQKAGTQRQ